LAYWWMECQSSVLKIHVCKMWHLPFLPYHGHKTYTAVILKKILCLYKSMSEWCSTWRCTQLQYNDCICWLHKSNNDIVYSQDMFPLMDIKIPIQLFEKFLLQCNQTPLDYYINLQYANAYNCYEYFNAPIKFCFNLSRQFAVCLVTCIFEASNLNNSTCIAKILIVPF